MHVAFIVILPILAVVACGFLRMVIRSGKYKPSDFYLSIDFTLAGLAAVITYAADISRRHEEKAIGDAVFHQQFNFVVLWGALGGFLVLGLLLFHQWGERPDGKPVEEKTNYWLLLVANAFGVAYLAVFLDNVRKPW